MEGARPHVTVETRALEEIGMISTDLKLNSLSDVDILTGTFNVSMRATFVWRLPKGLWPAICTTEENGGPDTGSEVAHALETLHQWPRFEFRGINEYRDRKVEVELLAKKDRSFRGLHLPLTEPIMSQRTSGVPTPAAGFYEEEQEQEQEQEETVVLSAAPGDEKDQVPANGGMLPPPNRRPVLAPTSSEMSTGTQRRPSKASFGTNGNGLQFALRGTSNFGGSMLSPDDEVFVKLKLTWVGAIVETSDLGDQSWDLGFNASHHPFDMHQLIFAVDFIPPVQPIADDRPRYKWPGQVPGECAFAAGWEGWAWQSKEDFGRSNFHRSVTRVFPGARQNGKNGVRSFRRRWQRVKPPTLTINPLPIPLWALKKKGSSTTGGSGGSTERPSFGKKQSIKVDLSHPPSCVFSFVVERDAPYTLIVQEIVKPGLLLCLGACKFKVPVEDVADRASIDFVLLLVLYEASDVGLPGVFDLLDYYAHFCMALLWISAMETFFAAKWGTMLAGDDFDDGGEVDDMWFCAALMWLFILFNFAFFSVVFLFKRAQFSEVEGEGICTFATNSSQATKVSPSESDSAFQPLVISTAVSAIESSVSLSDNFVESPAANVQQQRQQQQGGGEQSPRSPTSPTIAASLKQTSADGAGVVGVAVSGSSFPAN